MNKFGAEQLFKIGCLLGDIKQALHHVDRVVPELKQLAGWLGTISVEFDKIALAQSSKFTLRIVENLADEGLDETELRTKIRDLQELIGSEMESQVFLWVPPHRAEFYSKDAEAMIGRKCCKRFKLVQRELEEAAKCYALGRYTSSAFHLMRSTEAGVKALAKAIGYTPPHNQWDLVFKQMKSEFVLKPSLRPAHWQTHSDFLEEIWADLRAVSKAWRNDIAHLVDTYTEEEAKGLLDVIPLFLRHLASKMDENGKLY
jgi:hypothetical protein